MLFRFQPPGMKDARLIHSLVGVSAKEIALRLKQIRRQTSLPVTVEVSQRRAKRRHSHTLLDRGCDRDPPVVLGLLDNFGEVGIEEQIAQCGIALVSFDDSIQKLCTNNAPAAPDGGDIAEVQAPIELL